MSKDTIDQKFCCVDVNTPALQNNNYRFEPETESTASESVTRIYFGRPLPVAALIDPRPTTTLRGMWPSIAAGGLWPTDSLFTGLQRAASNLSDTSSLQLP